ncbi:MAG: cupin domain-containing protein [Rhodovulum sulfidophilum]|uniref:Cupin domain-containing protein n=1 Tax=Rhodovulum sulfidophilum TaxID=35806 RepID=A0A2W5PZ45_RHOSU|nr:MAG: cupin domain-containing protein [Rhodovulum sulfidophilum]
MSFLGLQTWIKADRNRTGGKFSMIEQIIPVGFESPWHVHHTEDESFYVIDGAMTVTVDGATVALEAGGYAFGPRGVPHGFRIDGDRPARILLMTSGGDFADFIAEASVAADAPPSAPDMDKLMAAAARNNLGILGPLPR